MRRTDPIELREGLVLQGLVLGHRFDDEVARLQVLEPDRAADAREHRVLRLRVELALLHEPVERLPHAAQPTLQQLVVRFDDDGVEPRLRRDLHDPRPHEAAPNDPHRVNRHTRPYL